jgi:hypothetical protein
MQGTRMGKIFATRIWLVRDSFVACFYLRLASSRGFDQRKKKKYPIKIVDAHESWHIERYTCQAHGIRYNIMSWNRYEVFCLT